MRERIKKEFFIGGLIFTGMGLLNLQLQLRFGYMILFIGIATLAMFALVTLILRLGKLQLRQEPGYLALLSLSHLFLIVGIAVNFLSIDYALPLSVVLIAGAAISTYFAFKVNTIIVDKN